MSYRKRRFGEWNEYHELPAESVDSTELQAYFENYSDVISDSWPSTPRTLRYSPLMEGGTFGLVVSPRSSCSTSRSNLVSFTLNVPPQVLRSIIDGRAGWEEALLSLRLGLWREDDVFDLTLMSLLRYGNERAQTRQMIRDREYGYDHLRRIPPAALVPARRRGPQSGPNRWRSGRMPSAPLEMGCGDGSLPRRRRHSASNRKNWRDFSPSTDSIADPGWSCRSGMSSGRGHRAVGRIRSCRAR